MEEHNNHDELMLSITKEYEDIFVNSEQSIYIYLDDLHKICNKKFATLLGYESEDEWAKVDISFPEAFVAQESQSVLVSAYQSAMSEYIGSTNEIVWKKKDGSMINSTVHLVPISHEGHTFALHFVESKL